MFRTFKMWLAYKLVRKRVQIVKNLIKEDKNLSAKDAVALIFETWDR